MRTEDFSKLLLKKKDEIHLFINTNAPRIIGKMAVDHFKNNFILGSFDGKKWKTPKRFDESGRFAGQKYGPLLSATNELMNSVTYRTVPGKAIISTDKVYAQIHNQGGTINVPVTAKMRKFAWAKHYETLQKDSKWKGMALTKKQSLTIKMPKRQFIGTSANLKKKIEDSIEKHLTKILM